MYREVFSALERSLSTKLPQAAFSLSTINFRSMAAGNLDVLQEVLKFTTETTKREDGSVSRTVEDEDMQWLKEALASLGDEEAKRLSVLEACLALRSVPVEHSRLPFALSAAEVHDVLIHATERPVGDVVDAVDFMCDFVDTYDSAKGGCCVARSELGHTPRLNALAQTGLSRGGQILSNTSL